MGLREWLWWYFNLVWFQWEIQRKYKECVNIHLPRSHVAIAIRFLIRCYRIDLSKLDFSKLLHRFVKVVLYVSFPWWWYNNLVWFQWKENTKSVLTSISPGARSNCTRVLDKMLEKNAKAFLYILFLCAPFVSKCKALVQKHLKKMHTICC